MKIILTESQYKRVIKENTEEKKYYLGKSKIHGKGVFAAKDLEEGEELGKAHTIIRPYYNYDFTELGKYHNHSDNPNCHNVLKNNERFLHASRPIKKGEELTTNYRLQPDLEQPKESFINLSEGEEKKMEDMKPEIDGYRTYSPFKDLDYIIVKGNGIDCDNIVWNLILLGDNGVVKFCKKDSGSHFLKGAKKAVQLPLKNGENEKNIFKNEETLKKWIMDKIESVDNKFEIRREFFN